MPKAKHTKVFAFQHRTSNNNMSTEEVTVETAAADMLTPHEHVKQKKHTEIRGFFKRTWKAVKRPFPHIHTTQVEPIVPPLLLDAYPSESDMMSAASTSGLQRKVEDDIEVVSVSGESLQSADLSAEATESVSVNRTVENNTEGVENNTEEQHVKKKKRTAISCFFRRTWKAVKRPFRQSRETRVEPIVRPLLPDACPSDSAENNTQEKHGKGTKKKRIFDCFKKRRKAGKRPDIQEHDNRVEPIVPLPVLEIRPEFEPSHGLESYCKEGRYLGYIGFGRFYEEIRKSDGKKVYVKMITKHEYQLQLYLPGHSRPLLREVALLLQMQQQPVSSYVLPMLEWFDEPTYTAIVLEHPDPCETLATFIEDHGTLKEKTARTLMRQAVLAVQHCIDHGVYHTSVCSRRMLVNRNTLELKLFDFGWGQRLSDAPDIRPPVVIKERMFITVGNLGVILHEMILGCLPGGNPKEQCPLSGACVHLLTKVQEIDDRLTLEQMINHSWFTMD
ncbi:serine/threonine-protein kinase pim-2-like [Triplophysa rosa]|uniref:non-specific serine/threonine protein kinase n=1 Tax=Triplophysa rosa TaxID=992332 RepID=A0A9W7X199_TRIRA|nr:serine/threonine-protein kinase pim-2-like [Triplophysa rosa]XP_057212506.1 serine/threonine-protein kinase pim-2-like [Triplophysa rosa]KAI7812595.1 putative serine/threonine-protein kinase ste20-like [Triplophysa rosa]